MTTGLVADICVHRDRFELRLALSVQPGTVAAVVGPNGAGKSTLLRALSGLLDPSRGRVSLDGRVLHDSAADIRVPPARRGIGVVFQDYLLFPHLTAMENVAFGLLARGVGRRQAEHAAMTWLERLDIAQTADARPARLSGGQAQRVAIARALVLDPPLLLLDEPLAALDASTRVEVRTDLGQRLREFHGATVLVTHDPVDAMTLGDEVVVLDSGSVAQRGTPANIAESPVNSYVADLLGLSRLPTAGGEVLVFSPSQVTITRHRPVPSTGRTFGCRVTAVEQVAGNVRMRLTTVDGAHRISADLDPRDIRSIPTDLDSVVWASVAAREA